MINNIYSLNSLIRLACEILKIKCPHIYYIKQTLDDCIIKDSFYENTNKEVTDQIRSVKEIKFDSLEYSLYINIFIFQNKKQAFIKTLKTIRSIYQLRQMVRLKKDFTLDEDYQLVQLWLNEYNLANQQGLNQNSALLIDREAFAYVVVGILFHISSINNTSDYINRYNTLYNQYCTDLLEIKKTLLDHN